MRHDIQKWLRSGAIRVLLCLPLGVMAISTAPTSALAQSVSVSPVSQAPQGQDLVGLFNEDFDTRLRALQALGAASGPQAPAILKALSDDAFYRNEQQYFIQTSAGYVDALTGQAQTPDESALESPILNNQLREVLDVLLSGAALLQEDITLRRDAIKTLLSNPSAANQSLIAKAFDRETDFGLKADLSLLLAMTQIGADDQSQWPAAFKQLGEDGRASVIEVLTQISRQAVTSADEKAVLKQKLAKTALQVAQTKRQRGSIANTVFSGLSLGSILMLAALGLAITYGLIGVINMAHGEFLMLGAYSTFVMQGLFQSFAPASVQDYYLIAAIPFAFVMTAGVGWLVEFLLLRHLYGRPLETLLATFGLSLVLMQAVRVLFGAQNVQVANPSWMSGAMMPLQDLLPGFQLPYNRLVILGFSLGVLALIWLLLNKTRMGLFVRATTQNRGMASCVGIPTRRIDAMAFSLGTGVAGLGGVALSQIGNVGPDLGQAYIIDSFMVVVLGGVGQLAGTVFGSFGLGLLSKFSEPLVGAVLTKIGILALIILFIQKRPSGLFALKGRSAEA
jgi:urea transport system permease protein